jgi:hypothetical protein
MQKVIEQHAECEIFESGYHTPRTNLATPFCNTIKQ